MVSASCSAVWCLLAPLFFASRPGISLFCFVVHLLFVLGVRVVPFRLRCRSVSLLTSESRIHSLFRPIPRRTSQRGKTNLVQLFVHRVGGDGSAGCIDVASDATIGCLQSALRAEFGGRRLATVLRPPPARTSYIKLRGGNRWTRIRLNAYNILEPRDRFCCILQDACEHGFLLLLSGGTSVTNPGAANKDWGSGTRPPISSECISSGNTCRYLLKNARECRGIRLQNS